MKALEMNNMQTFKEIFTREINFIRNLQKHLDNTEYQKSLDIISECSGKVIITGVGKSGHIASKIAATLASTGTPSFFVHPGEACHGDLGMIESNDLIIAISHSGESSEIMTIDYSNVDNFFNHIRDNRSRFGTFAESFQSED